MSEKLPTGGKPWKALTGTSQKGMSEKLPSEEIPWGKTGQANIRNSNITNSSIEKEQEYNHQDSGELSTAYSLDEVKRIIGFTELMGDAIAWGALKDTLHHFSLPSDKEQYKTRVKEMLDVLAAQVHKTLNVTPHPELLIIKLQSDAFTELLEELLHRWDSIRSVDEYVAQSLLNFFDCL